MIPYYFGPPDSSLFGCYHPPMRSSTLEKAVLICYPIGHEYIRCHRMLLQLTKNLCRKGVHVFRFDYYGTGDSAGDMASARCDRWVEDIETAMSEFRDISGTDSLTLVGLRLGGNLALKTIQRAGSDETLILCDPIVDMSAYLSGLTSMHQLMLQDSNRFNLPREQSPDYPYDLLGFKLDKKLQDDIGKLSPETGLGGRHHFLFSRNNSAALLKQAANDAIFFDADYKWERIEYIETALVAPDIIRQVTSLVEQQN